MAWPFGKQQPAVAQTTPAPAAAPSRTESSAAVLKNSYNQLSVLAQKTLTLSDDYKKVNVPGDSKGTAANYRAIQRGSEALLAQFSLPPDVPSDVTAVAMPLKEAIILLGKSSSVMADYLEGKLSLAPPNPDWVGRSQENFAQAQARSKEAQQALSALRKKFD